MWSRDRLSEGVKTHPRFLLPAIVLGAIQAHASAFHFANTAIQTGAGAEYGFANAFNPVSSSVSREFSLTYPSVGPGGATNIINAGITAAAAWARSEPGSLGVRALVSVDNRSSAITLRSDAGVPPGGGSFFQTPAASAGFSTQDVRFEALPGVVGGGTIPVSLNLRLDGGFTGSSVSTPGAGVGSSTMTLSLQGRFGYVDRETHFQYGTFFSGTVVATSTGGLVTYGAGTGLLSGYTGGTVDLTTSGFSIPLGVPVQAELRLELFGSATSAGGRLEGIDADFLHTLTFPTDGDVFNLPEGYTASSAGLGVADNGFAPVPEPGAWAAVGLAGAGLFGVARRRLRH